MIFQCSDLERALRSPELMPDARAHAEQCRAVPRANVSVVGDFAARAGPSRGVGEPRALAWDSRRIWPPRPRAASRLPMWRWSLAAAALVTLAVALVAALAGEAAGPRVPDGGCAPRSAAGGVGLRTIDREACGDRRSRIGAVALAAGGGLPGETGAAGLGHRGPEGQRGEQPLQRLFAERNWHRYTGRSRRRCRSGWKMRNGIRQEVGVGSRESKETGAGASGRHLLICCCAITASAREKYRRDFHKTVALALGRSVRIENSNGKVNIHTGSKGEVDIHAAIRCSANTAAEARSFCDQIQIVVDEGWRRVGATPSIRRRLDNSHNLSFGVDYDITMPETAPLELRNRFGVGERDQSACAGHDLVTATAESFSPAAAGARRSRTRSADVEVRSNDGDLVGRKWQWRGDRQRHQRRRGDHQPLRQRAGNATPGGA